jgi:hypothetical protein
MWRNFIIMSDNKDIILEEFETMKGQIVLFIHGKPERLVAVGMDEWDYYWIGYDGRELKWHTCLERIIPLKGYIRDEDYNEMVRLASINHYDQPNLWGTKDHEKKEETRKFNEQHKKEVVILGENDSLLTEICWDLN